MKITATKPVLENDLTPFIVKLLAQRHWIEFAFYSKSMRLIIDLQKRHLQQYLPLPLIRRSLSSLKMDKAMSKCLLEDLQECGFLAQIPRRGYHVSAAIDADNELPYQPSGSAKSLP